MWLGSTLLSVTGPATGGLELAPASAWSSSAVLSGAPVERHVEFSVELHGHLQPHAITQHLSEIFFKNGIP